MNLREERLRKKGWTEAEIAHAKTLLRQADEGKSRHQKLGEELLLWVLLALIAAGSLVGAWVVHPLLLLLTDIQAGIALTIVGILFGLFAGWIVSELEELEAHHHLFMTISIPTVAIVSAFLINTQAQRIMAATPAFGSIPHDPYVLAISYALATIIPYATVLYLEKRRYETR